MLEKEKAANRRPLPRAVANGHHFVKLERL
jgi:hypothetical protein